LAGIFFGNLLVGCDAFSSWMLDCSLKRKKNSGAIRGGASHDSSTSESHTNHLNTREEADGASPHSNEPRPAETWKREKAGGQLKRVIFPAKEYTGSSGTHPSREIICADALKWMEGVERLPGSLFTSLPDLSELDMIVSLHATMPSRPPPSIPLLGGRVAIP
jgi:hypothetical protein